jgi:hypothetical protein
MRSRISRNVLTNFKKYNHTNDKHVIKPIKFHKLQISNSYNSVHSTKLQTNTQSIYNIRETAQFYICTLTGNMIGLSIVLILYKLVFIS